MSRRSDITGRCRLVNCPDAGTRGFAEVKRRVSGADTVRDTRNEVLDSSNRPEGHILAPSKSMRTTPTVYTVCPGALSANRASASPTLTTTSQRCSHVSSFKAEHTPGMLLMRASGVGRTHLVEGARITA